MKNHIKFLPFFVLLVSFSSCKPILLKIKGITRPGFETRESILFYLSSKSFDTMDGVFVGKDSNQFFRLLSLARNLPSVDFYNSKGELIEYSRSGDCTGKAEKFAAELTPGIYYKVDSSYQFQDVNEKIKNINGTRDLSCKNADFTIFLFWAKYLGKMNQNVMDIGRVLKENRNVRTRVYLIDMDFLADWGMRKVPEINLK